VRRPLLAWTLFAVVAALPSAAVLVVAVRAATAETVRVHEEQRTSLVAASRALERDVEHAVWQAKETLRGLQDEDANVLAEQLRVERPPYSDVVVLDRTGAVVVPPAPAADVRPSTECLAAQAALQSERRTDARLSILEHCSDLRSESSRYVWPLLALERDGEDTLADVGKWLTSHDGRLSATERVTLRARVARRPPSSLRDATMATLDRDPTPYEILSGLMADPSGDDVVEGTLRTHRGRYLSVIAVVPCGIRAGYVIHEASLLRQGVPGKDFVVARGAAGDVTDLHVAPQMALHLAPRDHVALAAAARRRGDQILAVTVSCVLVSVALAALLFARTRRAQRLAELRTDFVAAVSHELRTPLASVRMLAELLEGGDVPADERAEVEQTLASETRRLASTLERMLRFGALARGKLAVEPKREPVEPLVRECAARFRETHAGREVVVEVEERLEADLDAGLMALVLDNLLSNAAKYAPDGGPYRLAARARGDRVVFSLGDKGPGLSRQAQARIFLPFERADNRLSRATEGTGVGLALVRGIARAHGGDAKVESAEGQGATFIVEIPKVSAKVWRERS
jgi:two-component system phosphate regulon sensor histidine kinase PhoR